jgi:hypothetical protein
MSDITFTKAPARPVSLITIIFLFAIFAAFLLLARHYYKPSTQLPQVAAAENLTKDLEWKATRDSRRATLSDLRGQQANALNAYSWADQKAGTVHLPIERAMELTVQKYGAK